MARALIGRHEYDFTGEGLSLQFHVTFYGGGVPGGRDGTFVNVTIPAASNKGQARTLIRDAIAAEAGRLDYPYNGIATLIDELFVGL